MIRRMICTTAAMTMALSLCSCSVSVTGQPKEAEEVTAAEETVTEETKETEEAEDEVIIAKETVTEEAEEEEEETVKAAGDEDLSELEKELYTNTYIGFLTEEFTCPEDITWEGVFYMGANLDDSGKYKDELEDIKDAYCDSEDDREIADEFGLDIIDGKVLRDFVKGTSGIDIEDVKKPLGLKYFDKWDIYVQFNASDANCVDIKLNSVETDDDGVMTVEYENAGEPFTLKIKRNGDYLMFISNEWTPSEGRSKAIHEMYSKAIAEYEKEPDYPVDRTGYYFHDMNGDGIDELFLEEIKDGKHAPNIFRVYSIRMGKLTYYHDIHGGEHDCFYLADDDTIYEQIYSGAAHSYFIHWRDGSENTVTWLRPIDILIFEEENEGGEEHPWYRATNIYQYEKEEYQESISEKEFNEWEDNMNDSLVLSVAIPLSDWK